MLFSAAFALNSILNFLVGLLMARFLGPEAFGVYALAFTLSLLIGGLGVEWLKHAAIRFYAPETAGAERVLARLHGAFAVSSLVVIGVALVGAWVSPWAFASPATIAVAAGAGLAFGGYEYAQALARQRGDARGYFGAVALRNAAMFGVVVGAWLCVGPIASLAAMGAAAALATLFGLARLPLPSTGAPAQGAERVRGFMAHGFPLVWAGALYAALAFLARSALAVNFGADEAGQFAFASDVGVKIVFTASSIVEVALLPRVMRTLHAQGREAAMREASSAMVIGFAIIAPLAAGYLVTLPAWEALIAPPAYRGHFSQYTLIMIPAFLAMSLTQACFTSVLIADRRSTTVTAAALVALSCGAIGLSFAQTPAQTAMATSLGYAAGLCVIAAKALSTPGVRPRLRDVAMILLGLAAMCAAVWPLRGLAPAWIALPAMAGLGAAVYGATLYVFDVAGLRDLVRERLARRAQGPATATN